MEQTLSQFISSQWPALVQKTGQQIYLVAIATFMATLIGIPLAVLAHYDKRLRALILSITNVIQTIPSLALLAFLLPLLGIGAKPAIIAMALYGLLPIVRATLTGIENISPSLLEAACAMGLTRRQILTVLELPLALPNIISGIKTSAVINVGVATLAAFIGAGGLGDFIMRGLMADNTRLILLGAIPAALLALASDGLIGFIARLSYNRRRQKKHYRIIGFTVAIIILLSGGLYFQSLYFHYNRKNTIVIASKNFTESMILAELMAGMIEHHSTLKVDRKLNLGSTLICQRAMENKEIDLYPEYTGTAYLLVLHRSYRQGESKDAIYNSVKNTYQKQFDITWLNPFGFNNSAGIAIREDTAKHYQIRTISDLQKMGPHFSIAAPSENLQRPDGAPGIRKAYGLALDNIKEMDISLIYHALAHHQIDAGFVFTTDGRIPKYHLQLLIDNKHIFPGYYAAPLVRGAILQKHSELAIILAPLANLLDEKTMQQLNAEVDIYHQTPHEVAEAFLLQRNL
ncbi:MAG: ABC transporter permease subunit [Gammaproteobacteria bacterium]|nr:ABC transporter permease subunit [Gammaproteobacteria bacterium]